MPLRNPSGRLSGRVVDSGGVGVPSAMVLLVCVEPRGFADSKRQPASVQADAQGRFRFESLRAGRWAASASLRVGHDLVVGGPVVVELGETRAIQLVLREFESGSGAQVVGVVRNQSGDPVAGADIRIASADGPSQSSFLVGSSRRTSTDSQGRFEVRELPLGPATLVASHPGYRRIAHRITIGLRWNEVTVTLEPGLEIAGSILSTTGHPIAFAWIVAEPELTQGHGTAIRSSGNGDARYHLKPEAQGWNTASTDRLMSLPGSLVETRADRNGDYSLTGLNPGVHRLIAHAEGYAESTVGRTVQLDECSAAGIDIVLEMGATVVVRVTGVSHARVALEAVRGHEFRGVNETVAGECRIDGVLPGDWTVLAKAIDGRTVRQSIALSAGQEAIVELQFEEGCP